MNRVLLLLLVFAFSAAPLLPAHGSLIDPRDADYVGRSVTVSGVVVALFKSKRGNVFINFRGKYTNQTFTGWIPAGTPLASHPWLKTLHGKMVNITGVIELYHGTPEIRITSKDQIVPE
jgi:DNA/RNA endonuclease YhcR with UshA esterase domain